MVTMEILDPRASPGIPISSYELAADTAQPGLRVALLSNCFFDATNLLEAVGSAVTRFLHGPVITLYESRNASVAATPDLIFKVAGENDVVVSALGHCGSCTSSSTRNAVAVARAGLPVCVLITERFEEASAFVARSVGMPDVPRVIMPHPVAGTGKVRIGDIAQAAAPTIISAWKGSHVAAV